MEKFKEKDESKEVTLTGRQKATLWIFGITFIVTSLMAIAFMSFLGIQL